MSYSMYIALARAASSSGMSVSIASARFLPLGPKLAAKSFLERHLAGWDRGVHAVDALAHHVDGGVPGGAVPLPQREEIHAVTRHAHALGNGAAWAGRIDLVVVGVKFHVRIGDGGAARVAHDRGRTIDARPGRRIGIAQRDFGGRSAAGLGDALLRVEGE